MRYFCRRFDDRYTSSLRHKDQFANAALNLTEDSLDRLKLDAELGGGHDASKTGDGCGDVALDHMVLVKA